MKLKFASSLITSRALFVALALIIALPPRAEGQHHHYKFIDIGTLGGPNSYFSSAGFSAQVITNRGVIAGYGDTPSPDPFSPNCFDVDCYLAHAFVWEKDNRTDLGALPGVNNSAVTQISRAGIVGFSENGQIDPLTQFPEFEAVFWQRGGIVPLGTLGGNESLAISLNNHGQVIGVAANAIPDDFSMFGWGAQTRAFLFENGTMQDLGTLGGPDAGGGPGNVNVVGTMSINQNGQVAGASYTNSIPDPILKVPTTDPFLWEKTTGMRDLGTLGGTLGVVNFLNNHGQVVGQSYLAGNREAHAFLWNPPSTTNKGGMTDLGTLGGLNSFPQWISDSGEIVGAANTQNNRLHAALWQGGHISDLGTVGNDGCSEAIAVNAGGQIVGQSFACTFSTIRAFIWENGSIADLNTLIPPNSSLQLVFAANITDDGVIVGAGVPPGDPPNTDLYGRLFLLIPCDENHPGLDGCDYSMVGVAETVPAPPVFQNRPSLPPSMLWHRNNRFRASQHSGPETEQSRNKEGDTP